jgi:HEAT repeat protein
VDPLLDLLATAEDRSTRAVTLRLLAGLGAPASERAIALLPNAPWFVQRNLLVLLGRIGGWPADLPPSQYLSHPEARVRREAIRLMLETPGRRDVGLAAGMMDADETIRTLALTAALEACPGHVLTLVHRIVEDASCPSETRALAIRVVARSGDPEVVGVLVRLALVRKFRFLRPRVAPKSPVVLAAVAGLAGHWSADPRATEVLARARRHRDFEIRSAASASA